MSISARTISFTRLGNLGDVPPARFDSAAHALKADGSIVVGRSGSYAFRWTEEGAMERLASNAPRVFAIAQGISDSGIIIGRGPWPGLEGRYEALRYTALGDLEGLGDLSGGDTSSEAAAISRDGLVIVGFGTYGVLNQQLQAAVWIPTPASRRRVAVVETNYSIVPLPFLRNSAQHPQCYAAAVSGDGHVIVGGDATEAVQWTRVAPTEFTPTGLGGGSSEAYGISADGLIVVGTAGAGIAVLWRDGRILDLGTLANAVATAATAHGSVVIGHSVTQRGEAFVWREQTGMRRLVDILTGAGWDMTNWSLDHAHAITHDGRYLVGGAKNPEGGREAFRVDFGQPQEYA